METDPSYEIKKKEFQEMVAEFLKQSPKHEMLLAVLIGTSLPVIRGYAIVGDIAPPPALLPVAIRNCKKLIGDHVCRCNE